MVLSTVRASISPRSAARDSQRLARVWETVQADSCPHTYNFHLHTLHSDGQLRPEILMQQAIRIGLQGLAITDHHTVSGSEVAQKWLEEMAIYQPEAQLPQLWTGVEITSQFLNTEVHILGYAFEPQHEAIAPYLQGEAPKGSAAQVECVIEAIHQAGGLAVLAHPERYRQPAKLLIPFAAAAGIDGAETYYAYKKADPWRPSPVQTQTVRKLCDRYGLYSTCGTDTHGLNILLRL